TAAGAVRASSHAVRPDPIHSRTPPPPDLNRSLCTLPRSASSSHPHKSLLLPPPCPRCRSRLTRLLTRPCCAPPPSPSRPRCPLRRVNPNLRRTVAASSLPTEPPVPSRWTPPSPEFPMPPSSPDRARPGRLRPQAIP
ncbi:hypothetical protein BRADI_4g09936v3, partial [Brachypodium distachyon]